MARSFNGSSDFISLGRPSNLLFNYNTPFSVSVLIRPLSNITTAVFPGIVGVAASTNLFQWAMYATNGNIFGFSLNKSGVSGYGVTSGSGFTVGSVYNLVGTYDGSSAIGFFVDGSSQGTTSWGGGVVSAPDGNLTIGQDGTGLSNRFINAEISEVAYWNTTLSSSDILSLARGVSPLRISFGSLVSHWSLFGRASPEPDYRGRNEGTLTGTSQAEHPRVYYPARPSRTVFTGATIPQEQRTVGAIAELPLATLPGGGGGSGYTPNTATVCYLRV